MITLGELYLPLAPESLNTVLFFLRGVASQLNLSEIARQEAEDFVTKSVARLLHENLSVDNINSAEKIVVEFSVPHNDKPQVLNASVSLHVPVSDSAAEELDAIQTVSEVMTSNIHLNDLLRLIIGKLVETLDAERGTLYLIDEERQELYSKVLLEDASVLSEIRVKIGEGIAGYVAVTGESLNLENVYEDARFMRSFDLSTGYHTRNMLTVPMRNPQQKMIGVVQVLNKIGGPFTHHHERMLVAMAAQASISIENARLHVKELEQQLLNQELETARTIQRSFLPSPFAPTPGWDVAAYWEPAHNVAGDFYALHTLPDGREAFIIADVSGKGVPAALFMALCVTVLHFAMDLDFTPAELLRHVNHTINSFNEQSGMFASILVNYLNPHTGEILMASGGHNPPLLYRTATGQCERIKARGILVGLLDEVDFEEKTIVIEENDILVLYTDGITEAMTAKDEEFGEQRLEQIIMENAHASSTEITNCIMDAVHTWCGERGAFDDETLVIIKRLPLSS